MNAELFLVLSMLLNYLVGHNPVLLFLCLHFLVAVPRHPFPDRVVPHDTGLLLLDNSYG